MKVYYLGFLLLGITGLVTADGVSPNQEVPVEVPANHKAILSAIRSSDPHGLRLLLTPGFCVNADTKLEYQTLAREITGKSYAVLGTYSLSDFWRFIKGGLLSGAGGYLCYLAYQNTRESYEKYSDSDYKKYYNNLKDLKKFTDELREGKTSFKEFTLEERAAITDKFNNVVFLGLNDVKPMTREDYFFSQQWNKPSFIVPVCVGLVLIMNGLRIVKNALTKKESFQRHCKALSVEAIINRLLLCETASQ